MSYAPIILFVYNRPYHTKRVLDCLSKNELFDKSEIIIFSDGNRSDEDFDEVKKVRELIENYDFNIKCHLIKRESNLGLSENIITGTSEILNHREKAIIMEDDILTSPYFLRYMNDALEKYENDENVWHISGWNYPIEIDKFNYDKQAFFWSVMNCWGWGTWKNRWKNYKKDPIYLIKNWSPEKISKFNLNDSFDFWSQVKKNYNGSINTWAIFWMTTIFEHNGLCLNPIESFVTNIGHDNSGENSTISTKFDSDLAKKNIKAWPNSKENYDKVIEKIISENFIDSKNSVMQKLLNKIKNLVT